MFLLATKDLGVIYCSPRLRRVITGDDAKEPPREILMCVHPDERADLVAAIASHSEAVAPLRLRVRLGDHLGAFRAVEWRIRQSGDELLCEIHEHPPSGLSATLEEAEREIINLVVNDAALEEILTRACTLFEEFVPGALCSVLLVNHSNTALITGAAPSLPKEYMDALNGLEIGPNVGCCGTAVAESRVIITQDIETDPRWAQFRALARPHGLRSCWSTPLLNLRRQPVGTFAVYHKEPHLPPPTELHVARELSSAVQIAIAWQIDRKELLAAQSRADDANAAKSAFLAKMSHELRTPLNAIIGFSDVLRTEDSGKISEGKRKEYLDFINQSGKNLLAMVDGLLDLSRIEAGNAVMLEGSFELSALLNECLTYLEAGGGNKIPQIAIGAVPEGLMAAGDRLAIGRVCLNILSNAVKHTPESGTISVSASAGDGVTKLVFRDTGKGIPKEHLSRLGQPYVRVSGEKSLTDTGTGLGLYISRSIVEQHGGGIEIESTVGVGTAVTVTLPARDATGGP